MTSPNKANIDQWLFDYFEGNLNASQEELLEEFLLDHPELDMDMEAWGGARTTSGVDVYPEAERLKRPAAILPLFIKWASIFILLFSIGGAVYYSYTKLNTPTYGYVDLQELVYDDLDKQLDAIEFLVASHSSDVSLSEINESSTVNSSNTKNTVASNGSKSQQTNELAVSNSIITSTKGNSLNSSNTANTNLSNESSSNDGVNREGESMIRMNALLVEPPVQIDEIDYLMSNSFDLANSKVDSKSKNSLLNDISRSMKRFVRSDIGLLNLRDPQYMIPGMTQNDMNFGHTGSLLATRVYSNTFVQWPNRQGQTVAMQAGVDSYVSALHGGVGFQMNYSNYEAGMFENYEGAFTYSPKIKVAKNILIEPSLRFKMGSRNLNSSRVIPGSLIEWERSNVRTVFSDGENPQGERMFYRDLGAGVLVNTKWAFLGVNVDNLGRHYNDIYTNPGGADLSRAPLNYVITAGTDYESFNKRTSLSTYVLYQNYGNLNKGWLGVNFRYRFVTVGGAISSQLDPVASLGLSFNHFRIAYMTDYTRNNISGNRMLSHQLSLRYTTKPVKNSRKLVH